MAQITLPENIYLIYDFFEKADISDFNFYKQINNINVKISKKLSNLNSYQIDIPINKELNANFIIKYFKNIDYRNYYSTESIAFKLVSTITDSKWIENEIYNKCTNQFICIQSQFRLIFYNESFECGNTVSQKKYYHCYKLLTTNDNYILRFELVLNNLDLDQDIDINIYLQMIINILKAIYNKFKINWDIN